MDEQVDDSEVSSSLITYEKPYPEIPSTPSTPSPPSPYRLLMITGKRRHSPEHFENKTRRKIEFDETDDIAEDEDEKDDPDDSALTGEEVPNSADEAGKDPDDSTGKAEDGAEDQDTQPTDDTDDL